MISMSFLATVATLALVYAMATQLLNLEAGWGGMWDLGVAGLIAVGAYSYVLLTSAPDAMVPGLRLPIVGGMLGAGLITASVAALIGWPALRLRGEYFLISTFAFAEIIRQLIIIGKGVTGAPSASHSSSDRSSRRSDSTPIPLCCWVSRLCSPWWST